MTTENKFDIKIYLICLLSIGFNILLLTILDAHGFGFIVSNYIAYIFLFYFAILHLFYARIKVSFYRLNLYKLTALGIIYGYISSLLSFLYIEAFFL